jgi:hypothetical protein
MAPQQNSCGAILVFAPYRFNEFNSSDEGWDANTNDDIEPANQWGNDLDIIKYQISLYRCEFSAKPPQDAAQ